MTTIAVLVGSLREDSVNRRIAELAIESVPAGVTASIVDGLRDVPFYDEDLDTPESLPTAAAKLRETVGAADAVLLITPEYNGTLSAVLKNAIDWISRPYGAGAVNGLPAAVISSSISPNAGKWARNDAIRALGVAGASVVDPEDVVASFGPAGELFGEAHPRENDAVSASVREIVGVLAQAVKAPVTA